LGSEDRIASQERPTKHSSADMSKTEARSRRGIPLLQLSTYLINGVAYEK